MRADSANRRAAESATELRDLHERMDHLILVCMAMWSLLREKSNFTEEQLLERVKQIDLADGKEDGQLRVAIAKCAQCGRVMSRRHTRCLYCGASSLDATAFDAVL